MKPLGRDRLGQPIYTGDYVETLVGNPCVVEGAENGKIVMHPEDAPKATFKFVPRCVTVDLERSPKRTDYERWEAMA